jgi:hypothetical protein
MGRVEQLRAELAAAELEQELVEAKGDPATPNPDTPEFRELKERTREARRVFRELRAGTPPEDSVGDAVVRPEPVKVKAKGHSPGGSR